MGVLREHRLLLTVISILVALKLYQKATSGRCRSKRRLHGMTAIVTGSNSGIGRETALDFARRGARVILACRNVPKAEAVRDDIIGQTGNSNVEVRKLDLSKLASVRKFAESILDTEDRLDILVNNAGMPGNRGKRTEDGIELAMQINHLGHLLLTHLLLDLLKRSAPSRVIFVSSVAHFYLTEKFDPDDLRLEKLVPYHHHQAYAYTKLCNVLTAAHLAKLLKGTGVTVNSVHPGLVMTEIWEKLPMWGRFLVKFIIGNFMKTSEEGAQTTIHVAVSEDVEDITGKYFVDCRVAVPSEAAQDEDLAQRVWERSCELLEIPCSVSTEASSRL